MKSNLYFLPLLALLILSCTQKETKVIEKTVSRPHATTKLETPVYKQQGDTIRFYNENNEGVFIAEGHLDSLHSKVYVKFENKLAGKLIASVKPYEQPANIRFNQIIYPDGSMDGPFGQDISTELTRKGENTLIIGHSMMAENPYIGKFEVKVQLNK